MKNLKGTKTLENLMKSFAGESQARNRYTFYASIANKEGYGQMESIFLETADNEKEHAKRFFRLMLEGMKDEIPTEVPIEAAYPIAQGNTMENLKAAASGEHAEWAEIYPEFAKVAENEGFPEVASAFRLILKVEEAHEIRYNKLLDNLKDGKVFAKDQPVKWICRNCGHVHFGKNAPVTCPTCLHPQSHFQIFVESY